MKIAISGSTGFIGSYLSTLFISEGYKVVSLERPLLQDESFDQLIDTLKDCQVVINLAGAPINHRWTKKYRQELYCSRIDTTRRIVEAVNTLENKPELFISTSAVGYYPIDGCFDENTSEHGNDFLSELCIAWEKESQQISPKVRLVNTRFGVVLNKTGGAYSSMTLPARLGVATVTGSGKQPFSWIALEDLGRAMDFIINQQQIKGIVNLVAPQQITNRKFTNLIAKHYHSKVTIRIPELVFRLLLGKAADFITKGQCVIPTRLNEAGFKFNVNSIEEFLQKRDL